MTTGDVPGPWLPSPSPHPRLAALFARVFRRPRRGTRGPGPVRPKQGRRPADVRPLPPYGSS